MIDIKDYEIFRKNEYKQFNNNGKIFNLNTYPYLDIVLGDHCNAKCRFCIGDLIDKKITCDSIIHKEKIKYVVDNMGVKEVLLVGGEPTIAYNLFTMIDFLNTLKLEKICLTTNGYRMVNDVEFCNKLLKSGITHLNLSLMSTDIDKQKYINQTNNFITIDNLKYIYELAHKYNVKIRINNNVFKDNNDTVEDILEFYNTVRPYCDSIKFSPLLKTDNFSVVDVVTQWVSANILSDNEYDNLWWSLENYFENYPIVRNKETFGFVEYSMIVKDIPIILNYNQHGQLRNKVIQEKKINNIKLLATGELSLSWNRNEKEYIIKC